MKHIVPSCPTSHPPTDPPVGRRSFFKTIGAGFCVGLPTLLAVNTANAAHNSVDLGSGDTGIMNYALALEGLEAEFYTIVMRQPYGGMTSEEAQILRDIRDHEIVHREFFQAALGANAIPALQYNFSKVNFSDRASVLTTAQVFEDLGVAAYNGAGNNIKSPDVLALAGKIVSVEARHASAIRDLISPGSGYFAPHALDAGYGVSTVLRKAGPFISTKLTHRNIRA